MRHALSRRALLAAVAMAFCPRGPAAAAAPPAAGGVIVQLGDTPVRLVEFSREPRAPTYVSLHENEQTSVKAAQQIIERRGGRLIELQAQRRRLVRFALGDTQYTFDPNRIFTGAGVAKTLRRYGPYSTRAHAAVEGLATAVLGRIGVTPAPARPLVVAVHNNTPGGLSVHSYRRGGAFEADAAEVSASAGRDPDDFFLVTERVLFEPLHALSFNVVLQRPSPTDDGSLSVYCQGRVPYVNVEARHDHLTQQVEMLEALRLL
jgi:hypothetical protein